MISRSSRFRFSRQEGLKPYVLRRFKENRVETHTKKQKQINIQIDGDVGSGEYSNFVVITHSPAEFVMDFTRIMPGVPKAKIN